MKRILAAYVLCVSLVTTGTAVAQDRVGLSFSSTAIDTVAKAAVGSPVTIYLLAFPADPAEELVGFSCRVQWDHEAIKGLTWQTPVAAGRDGSIAATFEPALRPRDGCVVLATAVGTMVAPGAVVVQMIGTPAIASSANLGRDVPGDGRAGTRLALDLADPDDLGPPGAPGKPTLD
jgi:hypothetical protein